MKPTPNTEITPPNLSGSDVLTTRPERVIEVVEERVRVIALIDQL